MSEEGLVHLGQNEYVNIVPGQKVRQFLRSTLHTLKWIYHGCHFNKWICPHEPLFRHSSAPHQSIFPPSEETIALIFLDAD